MPSKSKNPQNLITQSAFARHIQVSRQAISKLCKARLAPAMVGNQIDLDHAAVIDYADGKISEGTNLGSIKPEPIKKTTKKAVQLPVDLPKKEQSLVPYNKMPSFEEIENLTVREVVERWGTIGGFKLYVDSLKGISDWKNKELKFMKDRAQLVEIEPLATSLFSLVDLAFRRIVDEFPQAMAPQLKAIVEAGKDNDIIQMSTLMEKELSQTIRDCKSKITRDLNKKKRECSVNN